MQVSMDSGDLRISISPENSFDVRVLMEFKVAVGCVPDHLPLEIRFSGVDYGNRIGQTDMEKAIEALKHYADRMDDGGTARRVLKELEHPSILIK